MLRSGNEAYVNKDEINIDDEDEEDEEKEAENEDDEEEKDESIQINLAEYPAVWMGMFKKLILNYEDV